MSILQAVSPIARKPRLKFHRIKRFAVILAGTAALSGAVVPMAMADAPSGSGWADAGDCMSFQDTYDYYINAAADALASGDMTAGFTLAEDAAANKSAAEDLGCDTSTWAGTGGSGTIAPPPHVAPIPPERL